MIIVLCNTTFQKRRIRLPTWYSNDHRTKNQIDFIMVPRKMTSSVQDATVRRNHLLDSDHSPVIVKLLIKLKRYTKKGSRVRFNVAELKDAKSRDQYMQLLDSDSPTLDTVDTAWEGLRDSIRNAAEKTVGFSKYEANLWISEQTIALILKKARTRNKATKSKLRKDIKKCVQTDKNN